MERARSMQEYTSILQEILDELEELRFSIEYDEEFMGGSMALIEPMEAGVKAILEKINSGDYEFGKGDYEFFTLAKNANPLLLPFKHLVARAEATHAHGLED